jgi:hypothetical protein
MVVTITVLGPISGPGQQRDLDVRVARAFAAPGSGPVHRSAAADHQLDSPHLAHAGTGRIPGPGQAATILPNMTQRNSVPIRSVLSNALAVGRA